MPSNWSDKRGSSSLSICISQKRTAIVLSLSVATQILLPENLQRRGSVVVGVVQLLAPCCQVSHSLLFLLVTVCLRLDPCFVSGHSSTEALLCPLVPHASIVLSVDLSPDALLNEPLVALLLRHLSPHIGEVVVCSIRFHSPSATTRLPYIKVLMCKQSSYYRSIFCKSPSYSSQRLHAPDDCHR